MILAGDIGGTKTLLGLFEPGRPRPRRLAVRTFSTLEYNDLSSIVADFAANEAVRGASLDRACFGVAGPVAENRATLTNVGWTVDANQVAQTSRIGRTTLLNDLEAMAYAVPVLDGAELHVLQEGEAVATGNMALIAAGTGLGEALLHNTGGRLVPSASEAGHADFAARNDREVEVVRDLTSRLGRAEVEQIVSGPGIANLHRVAHAGRPCSTLKAESYGDAPAAISKAALEGTCAGCVDTLGMFVEAYGAEAGNLALRSVSTGGVFIGGGIAPKVLPALADGRFMTAFRAKAPLTAMLARMPVKVILNGEAGLLGAAVYAMSL